MPAEINSFDEERPVEETPVQDELVPDEDRELVEPMPDPGEVVDAERPVELE